MSCVRRALPTIFATGYGDLALRETDRGSPVLQKPYNSNDLARALGQALDGR